MTTNDLTRRQKQILALFGALLGGVCVVVAVVVFQSIRPAGTTFESLDDLRAQMQMRDQRDQQGEGNVSLRSIIRPHPSDDLIYTLAPDLDVRFQRVRVQTNSFGMRDAPRTLEKPAGTFRVAMLGDSFVFGWGVEEPQTFTRLLESRLREELGTPVEVLNFGVPGYSTFQEAALYRERVIGFNPDLVIVYFIDNDFALPFFVNSGNGLTNALSWVKDLTQDPERQLRHQALVDRIDANKALLRLDKEIFDQKRSMAVVLNPGGKADAIESKLWALNKPHHFATIKLRRDLDEVIAAKGIPPKSLSLPRDPHPSALKHELIARSMATRLLEAGVVRKPS